MSRQLTISYFASQDMLGMATDEEYERFKDAVLEALQAEWPEAAVSVEDDEEAHVLVGGVEGQAEEDVRSRVEDIVTEIVDAGAWQDEEEEFFTEEDDVDDDLDEDDY